MKFGDNCEKMDFANHRVSHWMVPYASRPFHEARWRLYKLASVRAALVDIQEISQT
jgi:hypothetical protein